MTDMFAKQTSGIPSRLANNRSTASTLGSAPLNSSYSSKVPSLPFTLACQHQLLRPTHAPSKPFQVTAVVVVVPPTRVCWRYTGIHRLCVDIKDPVFALRSRNAEQDTVVKIQRLCREVSISERRRWKSRATCGQCSEILPRVKQNLFTVIECFYEALPHSTLAPLFPTASHSFTPDPCQCSVPHSRCSKCHDGHVGLSHKVRLFGHQ